MDRISFRGIAAARLFNYMTNKLGGMGNKWVRIVAS